MGWFEQLFAEAQKDAREKWEGRATWNQWQSELSQKIGTVPFTRLQRHSQDYARDLQDDIPSWAREKQEAISRRWRNEGRGKWPSKRRKQHFRRGLGRLLIWAFRFLPIRSVWSQGKIPRYSWWTDPKTRQRAPRVLGRVYGLHAPCSRWPKRGYNQESRRYFE